MQLSEVRVAGEVAAHRDFQSSALRCPASSRTSIVSLTSCYSDVGRPSPPLRTVRKGARTPNRRIHQDASEATYIASKGMAARLRLSGSPWRAGTQCDMPPGEARTRCNRDCGTAALLHRGRPVRLSVQKYDGGPRLLGTRRTHRLDLTLTIPCFVSDRGPAESCLSHGFSHPHP